ncbi:MAG TPA: ATP-binding protein [Thermoanaerobaculia bacterium]|nr:ATP-binding protein [Thermoanaerobaculia bacterium]
MATLHSDSRMLIAVRVVVVTTLLLAALLIQSTVDILLPIDYLYVTAGLTYAMTLLYIGLGKWVRSREINLVIQLAGDLIIETMLVYFTGGIDSPFSFLYLATIITGSMLLYRRGGLITASGAAILYGGLVDLMYYGVIPLPSVTFFSSGPWTPIRLYLTMATNFGGFYATALLTSYISEKLRVTFEELDANRQNLAALQALNQSIIRSIPSGLITVTHEGTMTFINPAGCEILGRSVQETIGRSIDSINLLSPDQWRHERLLLETTGIVRGELDYQRDIEARALGYAMTRLNTRRTDLSGVTVIFQDLTEMKQLEDQLRLKDRMAAVGELSAGIAHEIRNPLAAIAGSIQMLSKSERLTPQEQRLMSIAMKESDRLNKSIADFLRFVRPQEKRATDFDVAASLGETLLLLSNSQELGPSHTLVSSIEPPSFNIFGDPDQIRQVFWNLARNAIQAMPIEGRLEISTELDDQTYRIIFADSGRGMSASDQRRLFQPFRTSFPSGTGLGMAICYRIVQEHGGTISVESTEGRGTRITVALPLAVVHARGIVVAVGA